ncbi:hypothetical protein Sden_3597 [Shewanella denitrificans OS217]|jgi:hypothetical protein|uniref:DUF2975 domain-containing protein n=2 Tax=Shewanella TaxID=22 RepID=Q12I54_SHEDO|nr:hypothetical protein Sden_3597 [Shewanella denitrificans OS217]
MSIMNNIVSLSRWVKYLLVFITLLQMSSFAMVMSLGELENGAYLYTLNWGGFYSHFSIDFEHTWQSIAQVLEAEGLHAGWILGSVELMPCLVIYFFLYRLFSLYQTRQIFTQANFNYLSYIALTCLAWLFISLLYPLLITLLLRVFERAEATSFYFSFGSQELYYLLTSLVIYCIAWIMKQAAELHDDAELTV